MTRSRNLVWACTAIGCSVVLYGFLGDSFTGIAPPQWTSNGLSALSRSSGSTSNVCQVEDIVYGEWFDDKPLNSMEEVTERYQLAPNWVNECSPIIHKTVFPNGSKSEYELPDINARTIKVASPYLLPRQRKQDREGERCTVLKPDRRNTIKRLLRSRNGLVLIGDSLTEHQSKVLITMLDREDGLLEMTRAGMWENGINIVANHSDIPELLREAGVTEERLKTPLVKFWRHHHLATDEEKLEAFKFAGDRYDLNPNHLSGQSWYEPMLAQATKVKEFMRSDSKALEEPSMIVLNLGAHLVWYELGKDLIGTDWLEGVENIVNMMEEKLKNAPIPLSPVIRTLAPGHVGCSTALHPDNNEKGWRSQADIHRTEHNYALFSSFNGVMWKARKSIRESGAFDFMADPQVESAAGHNPAFRVMDVWPMSAKRADGHMAPIGDCLHWCRAGVQNYWADLMFHMMLDESRNHDYL